MRLRFWLLVMDVFAWVQRKAGSAYLFAVGRASDATDWGEPPPERGEEAF